MNIEEGSKEAVLIKDLLYKLVASTQEFIHINKDMILSSDEKMNGLLISNLVINSAINYLVYNYDIMTANFDEKERISFCAEIQSSLQLKMKMMNNNIINKSTSKSAH